jgi:antitoxin component YwqK of YwqJK toxin-antitoxin module
MDRDIPGKEEGIYKRYYLSGMIERETPYKNGEIEGVVKQYYEDGRLYSGISYKNGKADGAEKRHCESGEVISFKNIQEEGKKSL